MTHVEVTLEGDGIHGILRESDGRETQFCGWLALIAAVEALRPRHADVCQRVVAEPSSPTSSAEADD